MTKYKHNYLSELWSFLKIIAPLLSRFVEVSNDKQILLSTNMKFGKRVQICSRLLR
jgi:hypothetical protein